jgi:hypothetical protein
MLPAEAAKCCQEICDKEMPLGLKNEEVYGTQVVPSFASI